MAGEHDEAELGVVRALGEGGVLQHRAQRVERGADPVGLVARGDDDEQLWHGDWHAAGDDRRRWLFSRPRVADVEAHITGTVWKIEVAVGDEVEEGDTVVILESMKMEMPVEAEDAGVVKEILCEEGQAVNEGDTLVLLE